MSWVRKDRPVQDNRRIVNGILSSIRIGVPWRDMLEKFGEWTTMYQCSGYRSMTGV